MSKYTRILCPVIFALLSAPTFADHVNISDWDISVVMHKIPDPNDCDCAAANPADPMRTLRDGVEYNNISAQSAINACEPIARRVLEKYKSKSPATDAEMRDLRAVYQLGRATLKSGNDAQALKINRQARELGYPYAIFYEHAAYKNGWGTARNPKRAATRLAQAIDARVPIAYLSRAEIELGQDTPNFTQIIDDLGRAEKGNISVAITWAQLHEKMGEHMLTSNQSCVAGHCGKKNRHHVRI